MAPQRGSPLAPSRIDTRGSATSQAAKTSLLDVWMTIEGANGESPYSFWRNCTAISWRPLLRGRERTTSQLGFTELCPAPGTSIRHIRHTGSAPRWRDGAPVYG